MTYKKLATNLAMTYHEFDRLQNEVITLTLTRKSTKDTADRMKELRTTMDDIKNQIFDLLKTEPCEISISLN